MPTYEYECLNCGHNFEASQKMTDKHINKCPECGKKVRRLIGSGAGIIFKGPGFYATDYRKQPKSTGSKESQKNICPKAKEGCSGCQ